MSPQKRPETWIPTLAVTRHGFKVIFSSQGASPFEFNVETKDLVRFYYSLRQALSGSAAKTRATAAPAPVRSDS